MLNTRSGWYNNNLLDWRYAVSLFDAFDDSIKYNDHYTADALRELLNDGWEIILPRADGQHFVYLEAVRERELRIIDTWDGQRKVWLPESARGIRAAHVREQPAPPPLPTPPPGEPISFHAQANEPGLIEYIRDVKPRGFKTVNDLELLRRAKEVSPDTETVWRKWVPNQGQFYQGNISEGVARFFNAMYDELAYYGDVIDYIEGLNEEIGTGCRDKNLKVYAFEKELCELLAEYGHRYCGPNIAVGNPGHDEVEDMIPLVRSICENNGRVSYHAYWPTTETESWLLSDLEHYAGRWIEWLKVFAEHDLYPRVALTEGGPISGENPPTFLNAGMGWRHPGCLNGNWQRHEEQLCTIREILLEFDVFLCLFTVGRGMNWDWFEYHESQIDRLRELYG